MGRQKVFIIDDDPDIREIVQANLEGAGYAVVEARDGVEGLRMVHEENPDLVILDVLMPEVDGWEVMRRIQRDPRKAGLPVIMLTCVSEDAEVLRGLQEGALEYLTKPFQPENVVSSVKTLLDVFDEPALRQARRLQLIARRQRLMGVSPEPVPLGALSFTSHG